MTQILPAKIQDAQEIKAILEENLLNIQSPIDENQGNKGFLVNNIPLEEIEQLIGNQNNIILVAKENNAIKGYLIACNLADDEKSAIFYPYLESQKITSNKIIYYRQIAKKLNSGKIGNILLENFLKTAKSQGYEYVICRIIHLPINNQRSISFHQNIGFKLIGESREEKVTAGIYLLKL
jgi:predicted GNAT superfamily acetyltransferase